MERPRSAAEEGDLTGMDRALRESLAGTGTKPRPVDAVTLDAGGTLIATWPSVGHVYAAVAAEHGFGELNPAELNRRFSQAWQANCGFDYSLAAWHHLVNQTFAGLIRTPLDKDHFTALYDRFSQPESWKVFDDVRPTLTALRTQGLKIGIVSNWDDRLRPLLAALGLSPFCDAIVVSSEIGWAKPAPEAFREAAARLEVPPARILHVGDSRRDDWEGARAAGFSALLLDRRSPSPAGPGVIGSLAGLLGNNHK